MPKYRKRKKARGQRIPSSRKRAEGRRGISMEQLELRRLLHGSAAALPFTNGLSMRLVGDTVTATGSDVVVWTDETSNGNDVFPTSGAPQVIHGGLNGHDVISLDGQDDSLGASVFSLPSANTDRTVYMLADYQSLGWGGFLYGADTTNEAFGVAASPNDQLAVFGGNHHAATRNPTKNSRSLGNR